MEEASPKKEMPKGVKKGGTVFPRINLESALLYADKLVRKTHTGAQARATIYPGVFGSNGTGGEIKASALRQFGLLEGDSNAINATDLAKRLASAPPEEQSAVRQLACLSPKVYAHLYDTFHGDVVSTGKLKQQIASFRVHPDYLDTCAQLFAESVIVSGLGLNTPEGLKLKARDEAVLSKDEQIENAEETELAPGGSSEDNQEEDFEAPLSFQPATERVRKIEPQQARGAGVALSIAVDSSMDSERLLKHLQALRQFGLI